MIKIKDKLKHNCFYLLLLIFLFLNLILISKHIRLTTSVYGDKYYSYANDLMERSPIYTSRIFPKDKIWTIESKIYRNLEFQDWELKLYLNAKNIQKTNFIQNKNCNLIDNKIIKSFKLSILKGNAVSGYSSFHKEIKVIQNKDVLNDIIMYDCNKYYVIEER